MQDVQIMVRVVNRASGQLKQVAQDAKRMGHSFKASQIAFQYLQFQAFAGLMAIQVGLVASAKAGFEFNQQMELMLMRWTNITGSAEKGQQMVDMFRQIVKETALTTEQISSFANRLLQAGIPVDELEGKLMGLANIQAKYGLSNEEAQRFVLGFTQSLSKGKLQAEEMNQMLEAGVPIYQILQDEFGWTREELHGLGKDADKTQQALDFLNGEFLEGTEYIEDYAKTMTGVLNRFQDAWVAFAGAVQEGAFAGIKSTLESLSGYLETVTEDIRNGAGVWEAIWDNMSSRTQDNINKIKNAFMILVAYNIGSKLASMGASFMVLASKIGSAKALIARINPVFLAVSAVIGIVVLAVMKLIEWYNNLKGQYPELAEAFGALKQLFSDLGAIIMEVLNPMLQELAGMFDSSAERAGAVMTAIQLLIGVVGGVAIVIAFLADGFMILKGTITLVVGGIFHMIQLLALLAFAMVNPKKAMELAEDATKRWEETSKNAKEEIATAFSDESFTNRVASGVEKAMSRAEEASNNMKTRLQENSTDILTSTTTSVNGQIRAYESQAQASASASQTVATASDTAGMAILRMGRDSVTGTADVSGGMNKAGIDSVQGAGQVQQAGGTVGRAVLEMGQQAQTHAPKVPEAVGKAGSQSITEAMKLPPELNKIGGNASSQYGSGIKSKSGEVNGATDYVGTSAADVLRGMDWSGIGGALIDTFAGGIRGRVGVVTEAVSWITSKVRAWLPSSDAKKGALSDLTYSGGAFISTFADGMYKKQAYLARTTASVMNTARQSLTNELGAPMFSNQQTITVNHIHQGQVDVVGNGSNDKANQFVGQSIGYEVDANGVRRNIRARGGS